jgi:hypothetical protein
MAGAAAVAVLLLPTLACRDSACCSYSTGTTTTGILTRNIDPSLPRMVMMLTDGNPTTGRKVPAEAKGVACEPVVWCMFVV